MSTKRNLPRRYFLVCALGALAWLSSAGLFGLFPCTAAEPIPVDLDGKEVFREHVRPILTTKCLTCHSPDKKKGKLDLSRRELAQAGGDSGSALVPGKPAESLLYRKIAAGEMPPQNPLSAEQAAAFKRWTEAGAPYESEPLQAAVKRAGADWWSLQPIKRPALPVVRDPKKTRTAIDAFIFAKLDETHLQQAPEADRATLIRRATFDLLGLPPTPAEVDQFVRDSDPRAYENLVDRLLASPHYGERWARHWLDVVRFAESHGYEMNTLRPNAWPYRDYLIRAFNEDTPYPQFILEQLAGDRVQGGDLLTQSATGFLVGGAHDMVGNATTEGMLQQRMDDLDDMVGTVGATFLGLTVNCCRCHDHKFDPLAQRDYYAMQALLAGVQHAERDLCLADTAARQQAASRLRTEISHLEQQLDAWEPVVRTGSRAKMRAPVHPRRNVEHFETVETCSVRFTITATNDGTEPCIDELEIWSADESSRNVGLASSGVRVSASSVFPDSPLHRLEHLNDGRYGNSRSWISREPGKGWVQVDLPQLTRIDRIVWGRDREERFKDRLATAYCIEVSIRSGDWQVIASSADRLPYRAGAVDKVPGLSAAEQQERATFGGSPPTLDGESCDVTDNI